MNTAVECTGIGKTFPGGRTALADVDLRVEAGTIHGLVGRNGAGKTTLMRILTGTMRPTTGRARVLGHRAGSAAVAARIGSLIEEPAFYPYLTGRQNLAVLARYFGAPVAEIDLRLDQVGLADRAESRFADYSLGMKQRLGIAAALLGDPALLVLDEPTNGLDPHAIVQMRQLLSDLRDQGRTVLVSSHLLAELEQVCEVVTIVHQGRVIQEGSVRDIRATMGSAGQLVVEVDDPDAAVGVLERVLGPRRVERVAGGALLVDPGPVSPAEITKALVDAGVAVAGMRHDEASLEDLYLELTRGSSSGDVIKARRA